MKYQMRKSVLNVIPESFLNCLTLEDFRLLLNGNSKVDVNKLISYTSFCEEEITKSKGFYL